MSFAIIKTGGKQYKVSAGEIIKVELLKDSKPESKIEFKEVLAYGDEKSFEIGSPTVDGAKVEADLIKNSKKMTTQIPFGPYIIIGTLVYLFFENNVSNLQ